jgi:hypothetical protein
VIQYEATNSNGHFPHSRFSSGRGFTTLFLVDASRLVRLILFGEQQVVTTLPHCLTLHGKLPTESLTIHSLFSGWKKWKLRNKESKPYHDEGVVVDVGLHSVCRLGDWNDGADFPK